MVKLKIFETTKMNSTLNYLLREGFLLLEFLFNSICFVAKFQRMFFGELEMIFIR